MLSYLSFHYFPMAGQNIFFAFILQVMQLTKKSYENILSQNNGIFFFLEGHDILPGSWYIDIFLRNLLQGHSRKNAACGKK